MTNMIEGLKEEVRQHWEDEVCGTRYASNVSRKEYFNEIASVRYTLEPFIPDFAEFGKAEGKKVLEIGVGAGSDFYNWVRGGAIATGIDLTDSAIRLTSERLELAQIPAENYELLVSDAENLPFDTDEFDILYSYGVLHHTPDTERAFSETLRVLKPGGTLKAMIYHVPSWSGWMLWLLHCLLKAKPWRSVRYAIYSNLESPGTKAYTIGEAKQLVSNVGYENIELRSELGPGDLLTIKPSKVYQNPIFKIIWKIYPRWFVRLLGARFGVCLLIKAEKPTRTGTT